METLTEFRWGDADELGEDPGEIVWIVKAYRDSDFSNALIGKAERIFCQLHADLIDINIDIHTGAALEDTA